MRKLASIQIVDDVQPIPNADRLEVASILGWKVVILKGKLKPGDKCVYIEVDSVLPDRPEYEFMRDRKFRVKAIKLRGQISMGLAMTLQEVGLTDLHPVGEDVTSLLNIYKYNPPIPMQLMGLVRGNRPIFVPKTDEIRIQADPSMIDELWGDNCYITTKYDGSSMSAYYKHNREEPFGVCSRNIDLKETEDNGYWRAARLQDLENKLRSLDDFVVIQGELIGPGIQKNRHEVKQLTFVVFDIYYPFDERYLGYEELKALTDALDLPMVDTEYVGKFEFKQDELLTMADGLYLGTNNPKEGIVVRPTIPRLTGRYNKSHHDRLSFKVLSMNYLLKED